MTKHDGGIYKFLVPFSFSVGIVVISNESSECGCHAFLSLAKCPADAFWPPPEMVASAEVLGIAHSNVLKLKNDKKKNINCLDYDYYGFTVSKFPSAATGLPMSNNS